MLLSTNTRQWTVKRSTFKLLVIGLPLISVRTHKRSGFESVYYKWVLSLNYRQAKERIFISGQIGLIPGQLSLPLPPSLATEMALSCQHVRRVVDALRNKSGGGWVGYTQLEIYWLQDTHNLPLIKKGHSTSKVGYLHTLTRPANS